MHVKWQIGSHPDTYRQRQKLYFHQLKQQKLREISAKYGAAVAFAPSDCVYTKCNDYKIETINRSPYNSRLHSMEYQSNDYYDRPSPQRRVLRQSTLPTSLQPPESYNPHININLMPPISPNNQQISPQYSSYTTTEPDDIMPSDVANQDLRQLRYPIRRQSTLPCRPNEHYAQKHLSTSPNRIYSRSPEKPDGMCGGAGEQPPRYPPFVRQSTFPSNAANEQFGGGLGGGLGGGAVAGMHRPKMLPTSPNRMSYNKSPDHSSEPDFQQKRHTIMRQNTLPNPIEHVKLLPTSPPKRQLSPQFMKRSPEMLRQNTLPNPECNMNTLNIPQQQTNKFLPISPRLKQNFLFPQPLQNPRQFLSQQNVPTADDPYSSTGSVTGVSHTQHVKMMKVRSHSNEEYSANRQPYNLENRRLLPEIPRNRSPR